MKSGEWNNEEQDPRRSKPEKNEGREKVPRV
jgi:hypothetical protein